MLSHNPNYSSGSHSLAPGWLRNRVILPPYPAANLIMPPIMPPQCIYCRENASQIEKSGRKYLEGGTEVLESSRQSFMPAICPESRLRERIHASLDKVGPRHFQIS